MYINVVHSLDEYRLSKLNYVLIGILYLVPELVQDHLGLSNGVLHDEAKSEVLVVALHPVLQLVLVLVQLEQPGLHSHVYILCTSPHP